MSALRTRPDRSDQPRDRMSQTLFDKVWDEHRIGRRADGRELLYIDRHVVHELHAPHAFSTLDSTARTVRRKDLTIVLQDHTVPTRPGVPLASAHIDATRIGAGRHAVRLVDVAEPEHGIVHVVSPELGIALPGLTLACPDSHASTVGALGCLAFGCGTSELVHVLTTQTMAMAKPRQMRINFTGALGFGVGAKDLALHLIRSVGVDRGRGACHRVRRHGDPRSGHRGAHDLVQHDDRMGRTHLPDRARRKNIRMVPRAAGRAFGRAVGGCSHLVAHADHGSRRALRRGNRHRLQRDRTADHLGHRSGTDGGRHRSHSTSRGFGARRAGQRAHGARLHGLRGRALIAGVPVDRVFIGSCSNSRLSDLRNAAAVLRGRQVAVGVRAIVVPGSASVKRAAEAQGLDVVFRDAGFEWHNAGCSMCAGANGDTGAPGERCVATSNRNFENRQGRGVRTHLASPAMAAAAAVAGCIVDVRQFIGADRAPA